MLQALLLCLALPVQPKDFDFFSFSPYTRSVGTPESFLSYSAGQRHTTFREQEKVILGIADAAKDRIKVITFGKSVEGRPLRIVAVSSPENLKRLDEIRQANMKLANPEAGQEAVIPPNQPAIVWINECIHGDETASFESAMWLLYNLAASNNATISSALKNVVVLLNPSYNPDGHERFVVWFNSVSVGNAKPFSFEHDQPGIVSGRLNHYRFDMNRDRTILSQDETRQEVEEFLRWRPQVYVDQHGETSSFFFPPTPMSVNANVGRARYGKWTDIFGQGNAKAFDMNGWTYFVKDTFDLYYPGYLDSWTTLNGAIGMTHETDGGGNIAVERDDGSMSTLRGAIAKHFTAALAVIGTASKNRAELLQDYATFKQDAVSGKVAGKFQRVVVPATEPADLVEKLESTLQRHGIDTYRAGHDFRQKATAYLSGKEEEQLFPKGSLVIDIAQPQGALAKALLMPGQDFEAEFTKEQVDNWKKTLIKENYPRPDRPEFYDLTGWCLIYAFNLDGYWCDTAPKIQTGKSSSKADESTRGAGWNNAIGWALRYQTSADIIAVAQLLSDGVRIQATTKLMTLDGVQYVPGTFLIMKNRNDEAVSKKLEKYAKDHGTQFEPLSTSYPSSGRTGPGSDSVFSLKKPNIAIVFGNNSDPTDFGAIWYLMEREFGLPFTPISKSALNGDLRQFSAIVFPGGVYDDPSPKLKEWVQGGGALVALGSVNWATGDKGFAKFDPIKIEDKVPTPVPGSIFKAQLDSRYFLAYGYAGQGKVPFSVPFGGRSFFKAKEEGGGVVAFSADAKESKLLSGWEWPDETEKALSGSVWLHDQPVGSGHAILFFQDPTDRAMWPGLNKLLLNSMILGPGY